MVADRMRLRFGFRARVLGSFVALVVGALSVGLLIQRAVLLERLDTEIDNALEHERSELQRLADGRDPATGEPFGGDVRAIFDTFLERSLPSEGQVYLTFVNGSPYKSTPAPIRLDQHPQHGPLLGSLTTGEWGALHTDAGKVRYLAVPMAYEGDTHGLFVAANFVEGQHDEIDATIRVAAAVTGGVLVVATAVAWLVGGRLLRPVRQLSEAAEAITDTDLDRRIPVDGDDEIARLARRFNEMLDRLAGAFSAQRAFVDDAGHELRTPITIVRGHLELMGDDPADQAQTIALVTDELDRMARIVDDLLLLAKAEQPDFVRREPVEVSEFTSDLLVKARALGDRPWRLDGCATGTVMIDEQRITQAVLNLARNADEHTPPGTDVGLGSAWGHDGVRLWVRDEGPGIEPDEQARIFERFTRGRERRRRSEGAGLGLSIVTAVAEAHGGHVEVDSRSDHGATFTIVLPSTPPPQDDVTAPLSRLEAAGSIDETTEMALPGQKDPA